MKDTQHTRRSFTTRLMSGVLAFMVAISAIFGHSARDDNAPEAEAAGTAALLTSVVGVLTAGKEIADAVCGEDSGGIRGCAQQLLEDGSEYKDALEACSDVPVDERDKCIEEALAEEEEEEEEEPDQTRQELYTFYRMQSALTAFYGNQRTGVDSSGETESSSDEEEEDEDSEGASNPLGLGSTNADVDKSFRETWSVVLDSPANAGIFVGYDDFHTFPEDRSAGAWGGNQTAGSNAVYTHALMNTSEGAPQGIKDYMLFGATLHGLGLDQTSGTGNNQGVSDGAGRFIMGSTMMVAYVASGMIDVIFELILNILQVLNPFAFFYKGAQQFSQNGYAASLPQDVPGPMKSLAEFITKIYDGAVNFGMFVTVPVTLGLFIMGALMFRRTDNWQRGKKVATRVVFLVVGIPLIGVTYTGALTSMAGAAVSSGSANSTKIIISNYVDYEKWANQYRLAIPKGAKVEWDDSAGEPTKDAQSDVRRTTYLINTMINEDWAKMLGEGQDENMSYANGAGYMNDMMTTGTRPGWYGEESGIGGVNRADAYSKDGYTATIDLLGRYTGSQALSGAAYGSAATDWILNKAGLDQQNSADREAIEKAREEAGDEEGAMNNQLSWIADWNTVADLEPKTTDEIMQNPLLVVRSGLEASTDNGVVRFNTSDAALSASAAKNCMPGTVSAEQNSAFDVIDKGLGATLGGLGTDRLAAVREALTTGGGGSGEFSNEVLDCNLAPVAMYNYLNSAFNNQQVTVDSANRSSSNNARSLHQSVAGVGTGAAAVVYWFSAMSLLMSFVIIGFVYAFSMLFNCIKRGIQLIMAVPFALIGFMAGIAKVVVYAIVMILEILGTLFVFRVVQEFLMTIPQMIEAPLIAVFGAGNVNSDFALLGAIAGMASLFEQNKVAVTLLITLAASAGVIIFTLVALRLRSSLVAALDEAATRMINKFLDTNVSAGGQGGRAGMAAMAGRTATMAMMYNGMNGGDGNDADAGVAAGADGAGGASDAGTIGSGDPDDPDGSSGSGSSTFGDRMRAMIPGLGGAAAAGTIGSELTDGGADPGIETMAQTTDASTDGAGEFNTASYSSDAISPDELQGQALQDAEGNYLTDIDGNAVTEGDIASTNAAGNLVDYNGNEIVDAQGNPVSGEDYYGDSATIAPASERNELARESLAQHTDASGNMTAANGDVVTDAQGNPVRAEDVAGVNAAGNLVDSSGNEIVDANGEAISGEALGMPANSSVEDNVATGQASDYELADQVRNNGGLSTPTEAVATGSETVSGSGAFEGVTAGNEVVDGVAASDTADTVDSVATGQSDNTMKLAAVGAAAGAAGASALGNGEKQLGQLNSEAYAADVDGGSVDGVATGSEDAGVATGQASGTPQTVGEAFSHAGDQMSERIGAAHQAWTQAGSEMSAPGGLVSADAIASGSAEQRAAATGVPVEALNNASGGPVNAYGGGHNDMGSAQGVVDDLNDNVIRGSAASEAASTPVAQSGAGSIAGVSPAVAGGVAGLAGGQLAGMRAAGNQSVPNMQPATPAQPGQPGEPGQSGAPVAGEAAAGRGGQSGGSGSSNNPMRQMMAANMVGGAVSAGVRAAGPSQNSVARDATSSVAQNGRTGNRAQRTPGVAAQIAQTGSQMMQRNMRYNMYAEAARQNDTGRGRDERMRARDTERDRDPRSDLRENREGQGGSAAQTGSPSARGGSMGRSPGGSGADGSGTVNV